MSDRRCVVNNSSITLEINKRYHHNVKTLRIQQKTAAAASDGPASVNSVVGAPSPPTMDGTIRGIGPIPLELEAAVSAAVSSSSAYRSSATNAYGRSWQDVGERTASTQRSLQASQAKLSKLRTDFDLLNENNRRLPDGCQCTGGGLSFAALNQHAKQLKERIAKLSAEVFDKVQTANIGGS
jgi:hypothetical protein